MDRCEQSFLNHVQVYPWDRENKRWKNLILLLEGETVKLPTQKNLFAENVVTSTNVTIFATSRVEITYQEPCNITSDNENAKKRS